MTSRVFKVYKKPSRYTKIVLGVFVAVAAVVILVLFVTNNDVGSTKNASLADTRQLKVDAFIEVLRSESLEESLAGLADDQAYLDPGFLTSAKLDQIDVYLVLSNRRFHKVREELLNLPENQRKVIIINFIDYHSVRLINGLQNVISFYEKRIELPQGRISLLGQKLALSGLILLAAEQGYAAVAHDAFARVHSIVDDTRLQILAIKRKVPQVLPDALERSARIQPVVMLNAYHRLLAPDSNSSTERIAAVTGIDSENFIARVVQLVPYKAKITSFDYRHVLDGDAIDKSLSVRDEIVFAWHSSAMSNTELQQVAIEKLEEAIMAKQ